jgi:hypothetical protein
MGCRDKYVTSLPQLAMNRFLPLATQIPILWIHTSGGGGSDIRSMSSIGPICKCRCPPLQYTDTEAKCRHKKITRKATKRTHQFHVKLSLES